jgi:predicted nuclease of restriction endonuclease-like (RecB) superfamily
VENNINLNNEASNRSAQAQQRVGNCLSEQSQQIANSFRERAAQAKRKFAASNAGTQLTLFQQQDIERQVAFDLAKKYNWWIEDFYSLGKSFNSGNENTVALSENEAIVYKSNNLMNVLGIVSNLLNLIEAHNLLFPETTYEIVGFTGFENRNRAPYIEVIMKQPFVDNAEHASYENIADYMYGIGFTQVNQHTFENEQYIVSDLHPRNVLKNDDGVIFVIDNKIEKRSL